MAIVGRAIAIERSIESIKKPWTNVQNQHKKIRATTFAIAKLEEQYNHYGEQKRKGQYGYHHIAK